MKFFNRENEKQRILKALESKKSKLIIVHGRRRCGKSTLIRNILGPNDIYYMAQQTDEAIQRNQFANVVGEKIAGFDSVQYPNWDSLFVNLNNVLKEPLTICIDEFPYLIKGSLALPSLFQKIVDTVPDRKYHLILCGSAQQMMQGLVLHGNSPLYGRADEILMITPLEAGWLPEALQIDPEQSVMEYSVWGGVPRYWELRTEMANFETAVKRLAIDHLGILHEEPSRLFLDDMRESIQSFSILTIVGSGSNRLSEIAGKLNKPSTQLSRPIDNLIQLGYLKREIPFGELAKNSKKGIYRIADPFMNFYFTFIAPNISRLELGLIDPVYHDFESRMSKYVSLEWENLCRRSVPMNPINGTYFDVASRWWGTNTNGEPMELDVVAESIDKKLLLVGECKWSKITNTNSILKNLENKASLLPFAKDKQIVPVLFIKEVSLQSKHSSIFLPNDVLNRLKR